MEYFPSSSSSIPFSWLNLELKMHAILNFRSPERAVNKYEIKCLLKCCGRDVDRIETSALYRLQRRGAGGEGVTGVASRVGSLRSRSAQAATKRHMPRWKPQLPGLDRQGIGQLYLPLNLNTVAVWQSTPLTSSRTGIWITNVGSHALFFHHFTALKLNF